MMNKKFSLLKQVYKKNNKEKYILYFMGYVMIISLFTSRAAFKNSLISLEIYKNSVGIILLCCLTVLIGMNSYVLIKLYAIYKKSGEHLSRITYKIVKFSKLFDMIFKTLLGIIIIFTVLSYWKSYKIPLDVYYMYLSLILFSISFRGLMIDYIVVFDACNLYVGTQKIHLKEIKQITIVKESKAFPESLLWCCVELKNGDKNWDKFFEEDYYRIESTVRDCQQKYLYN